MSNDFQAPPPSYTEVIGRSAFPVSDGRAMMYTVPQLEQTGDVKYSFINPTIPVAYGAYVVPRLTFGRNPVQCTCANCRSIIVTRVEYSSGLLTWLLCLLLLIFGCWLGCCCIPFCISDFKNVQHYCPNCHALVGGHYPL